MLSPSTDNDAGGLAGSVLEQAQAFLDAQGAEVQRTLLRRVILPVAEYCPPGIPPLDRMRGLAGEWAQAWSVFDPSLPLIHALTIAQGAECEALLAYCRQGDNAARLAQRYLDPVQPQRIQLD